MRPSRQAPCHPDRKHYAHEPTEPKHLRVGINSAMCDHTALVKLLIAKGVITEDEYLTAVADEMELEVERYQSRIRDYVGSDSIKLA